MVKLKETIQAVGTLIKKGYNEGKALFQDFRADLSVKESEKKKWQEKAKESKKKAEFYEDRYREIMGKPKLKPTYDPMVLEKPDTEALEKSKGVIDKHFPDGRIDFTGMSMEKRADKIYEILQDVSTALEVDVNNIIPEDKYWGAYILDTNCIKLNSALMAVDDPYFNEEAVLTIFHELYHAREREASMLRREYGYSNERLTEWYKNWLPGNYISPEVDDEAYHKQAVERDAFRFENMVRQYINNLKNGNRQ